MGEGGESSGHAVSDEEGDEEEEEAGAGLPRRLRKAKLGSRMQKPPPTHPPLPSRLLRPLPFLPFLLLRLGRLILARPPPVLLNVVSSCCCVACSSPPWLPSPLFVSRCRSLTLDGPFLAPTLVARVVRRLSSGVRAPSFFWVLAVSLGRRRLELQAAAMCGLLCPRRRR